MNIVSSGFNNDIIIVGQQPWDTEIGSNCKDIALELSKTNRVLYINSALNRITLMRGKDDLKVQKRLDVVKKKEDGLVKIKDNLWTYYPDCIIESINWINYRWIFNLLNKYNNWKFAKSIRKAVKKLKFRDFVLFNDNEMFLGFYLEKFLAAKLNVYYARDYMIAVDYWKKHGEVLEPLLIAKSDLCFTNSEYLAKYCRKYNAKSYNVGQGCDIESFKITGHHQLEELSSVKTPLIGYVGSLSSLRLDIDLIEQIARSYPQYTVVLVGQEDDEFISSGLHQLSNVLFLGQKPAKDLPLFINAFDVCINPQIVNQVTIGNYPRKIDEYLALGKSVVATHTITMEVFKDFVYLANNNDEFIELIALAIEESTIEKMEERKKFAFTHTWEKSVGDMKDQMVLELSRRNNL